MKIQANDGATFSCVGGGCNRATFDWLADIPLPSTPPPKEVFAEVSCSKGLRKDFFRVATELGIKVQDMVVVATDTGYDMGVVSLIGFLAQVQMRKRNYEPTEKTAHILRKATEADLYTYTVNKQKERHYLVRARKMAEELHLDMKISQVDIQANGKKATFYYTADERVDFRELIKRYVVDFGTRIEMRQIGARQEAKQLGALGSCGRVLCCSTWMTEPENVNISAIKYQGLTMNKAKMNGQCGRLKCCLNFELDFYVEKFATFPKQLYTLNTNLGEGKLIKKDILKTTATYVFQNGALRTLTWELAQQAFVLNQKGQIFTLPQEDTTEGMPTLVQSSQFNNIEEITLKHSISFPSKHKHNQKRNKNTSSIHKHSKP